MSRESFQQHLITLCDCSCAFILTPEQHAIGMAVRCMLEESLYFGAIIQMRWGVARSFWGITLDAYFKDLLPNPLRCRDQAEGGEVVVSN